MVIRVMYAAIAVAMNTNTLSINERKCAQELYACNLIVYFNKAHFFVNRIFKALTAIVRAAVI
tara:strand:- start:16 stop:204 length:189 start_codon:yes stop_codon:yes gene_type:complete